MTDENEQLGPIRPKHVRPGWRLDSNGFGHRHLTTHAGAYRAKVFGTGETTCAWAITGAFGRVVREAPAVDVDDALDAVEAWLRGER